MEQPAVGRIMEAVIDALDGSDSTAFEAYLDDETVLHMPGGSGLAGEYRGREAICALLDRLTAASHGTLCFETVCRTTQAGDGVRLGGQINGQRHERTLRMTAALQATVDEQAIREVWLVCSDQPAWDRFWS